MNCL